MAQLKNTDKARKLTSGSVTVGNNRTISRNNRWFVGSLHGHPVFNYDPKTGVMILNHCGYKTTTTRSAMQDFASVWDLRIGVSFARGEFSARWGGKTRHGNAHGEIRIETGAA